MAYRTLSEAIARGHGRERSFRCPVHNDHTASASVNVIKGLWVCYACGAKGTVEGVIEQDDSSFFEEMNELLDMEEKIYPESWLDLYTHSPGPYWSSRGFSKEAIRYFRLGTDWTTKEPVYPIRASNQDVLGVVRRSDDPMKPKYLYPKGVVKSHLLFNYQNIESNYVVLTEGAPDAIASWDIGHMAFGLYGATMHARQIELLQKSGVSRIVLALDNDTAGQRAMNGWLTDEGIKVSGIEERLFNAGFEVVRPSWEGVQGKDLNDLDSDTRKKLLDPLAL